MQVVIAPTKFWLPSSTSAGPNRICFSEPVAPTLMRLRCRRLPCGLATLHNFESHVIPYSVSDNHGNAHLTAKLFQIERLVLRRNVSHRRHRALYDENVRTSLLRDLAEFGRSLRNGTNRRQHAAVFNLAHTRRD